MSQTTLKSAATINPALNATYLACPNRGFGLGSSDETLKAAEILLEQGISYVASVSERYEQTQDWASTDDVVDLSSEQQGDGVPSRILL